MSQPDLPKPTPTTDETTPIAALLEALSGDAPRAAAALETLARRALGDLPAHEQHGGDGVGTDAYEAVRDGFRAYTRLLEHADGGVRRRAAYLLAFLVDVAAETQGALDAAAARATDPAERAVLRVAAGRLRASVQLTAETAPAVPWEGIELDAAAQAEASPLVRGAVALGQVMALPHFPRKCQPEVAAALDALVEGAPALWPWDMAALAPALKRSLWVQEKKKPESEGGEVVFQAKGIEARLAPAGEDGEDDEDDEDDDSEDDEDDEDDDSEDDEDGGDEELNPYHQQRPARGEPRIALAGLDAVDWASLEDAYGPASAVPGMLRALSSASEEDRRWAIDSLEACIHHQGSVYAASTAAVPFLIELAGHDALEGREHILELLTGIAVHQPDGCLVNGAFQWRSEAWDAVLAGAPAYLRLLGAGDARVRTAAAHLVAFLAPPAAGALEALREALDTEPDRRARSSLLLALGYVSRYLESRADRTRLASYLGDPALLVRASAAIALMQMEGPELGADGRAVLDEARRGAPRITGYWPWNEGDLRGFAAAIRQAIQSLADVLADLDAASARGDERVEMEAATRALGMLMKDEAHGIDALWLPEELDADRRRVIAVMMARTRDGGAGRSLLPHWEFFNDRGLPTALDGMRRLLGVDPPGPVDARLALPAGERPAWWALHGVVAGGLDGETVCAALRALDPEARAALVKDAIHGPYDITRRRRPIEYGTGTDCDDAYAYTSRFILLAADVLLDAGAPGVAWARRTAEAEAPKKDRRDATASLIAALVLTRDAIARGVEIDPVLDVLLAFDQAPASTYLDARRAILPLFPAARAASILGDRRLYTFTAYTDPRGEVRRFRNEDGWDYLALMPPATAAAAVVGALREWERHRAAGDDPHAEPVGGRVSATIKQRPGEDEPFPRDRAIAALAACGDAGAAAIEAAVAAGAVQDRELPGLVAARRAAPEAAT